jgi:hypothetical protein
MGNVLKVCDVDRSTYGGMKDHPPPLAKVPFCRAYVTSSWGLVAHLQPVTFSDTTRKV